MVRNPAPNTAEQVRHNLLTALGNRRHETPDNVQPQQSFEVPQTSREHLREAVATLQRVSPAELSDSDLDQTLERIRESAAEDADRVGHYLNHLVEHLLSIDSTSVEEISAFLDAAEQVLGRLYDEACQPHPSPSQLLRLALQYALDARRPIEGGVNRFELRRQEWGYEIAEYPSSAMRVPAIPLPGRPVRNPLAVHLLDLVQQGPPQIYELMNVIERLLEDSPRDRDTGLDPVISGSEPEPQLRVDFEESTIVLRGTAYPVDLPELHLLQALQDANGRWIPGPQIQQTSELVGGRPDRIIKKLPSPIQDLIESQGGKGYRLRVERLE